MIALTTIWYLHTKRISDILRPSIRNRFLRSRHHNVRRDTRSEYVLDRRPPPVFAFHTPRSLGVRFGHGLPFLARNLERLIGNFEDGCRLFFQ